MRVTQLGDFAFDAAVLDLAIFDNESPEKFESPMVGSGHFESTELEKGHAGDATASSGEIQSSMGFGNDGDEGLSRGDEGEIISAGWIGRNHSADEEREQIHIREGNMSSTLGIRE